MEIKYIGENAISYLINKCKATFSALQHTHSASDVGADADGSASAALALAEQYTDEAVSTKVDKSGDTMSGYLNFEKNVNGVAYKASFGASSNGNTYIQHYTDGTLDNYITLNKNNSFASKPWSIDSGGTGANTAAQALTNLGLTATASELNTLDGIIATVTELNYTDGLTSNIQAQLDSKLSLPSSGNGTAGQFVVSDGNGGTTWLTVVNGNEVAY